jgi:hypothetical protein
MSATTPVTSAPQDTMRIICILNRPAYSCASTGGQRGMEMTFAKDARGLFPEGLRVRWIGEAGARFLDANIDQLRPGRGVQLAIYHLRARDGELRAHVANAQLAPLPPSWRKHQQDF